ncbi:hypothetical protein [Clostridium sp. C8-1-8]|uniref:hypothetical protein n=1 Tax=Clostridium sp. C8-1-8 TaxID=2698831 RepID=UPI001369118D|nr:hypothetical protein [Clostridium sp. C8-1-8]
MYSLQSLFMEESKTFKEYKEELYGNKAIETIDIVDTEKLKKRNEDILLSFIKSKKQGGE